MTQDGLGFGANGSINLHDFLAYVRCLHCLAMNFSLDSSSGAAKYDNPFIFTYFLSLEHFVKIAANSFIPNGFKIGRVWANIQTDEVATSI